MNPEIYKEIILEHYRNPQNSGELSDAQVIHTEFNPLCGDKIKVFLKVESGVLTGIAFQNEGCAISTAAASIMSEKLKGQSVEVIRGFNTDSVLDEMSVEISSGRIKCATLFLKAIQEALKNVRN